MKQKKEDMPCIRYFGFFLIVLSILIVSVTSVETSSQSSSTTYSGFLDGIHWPVSSTLSISSSTQTQSSPVVGQAGGAYQFEGIIAESRNFLAKGGYNQQLIRFANYGQIMIEGDEGTDFTLYTKKGTVWPDSNTFRTDFDQTVKVPSKKSAVLNVGPGPWIFTIEAPNVGGVYYLIAWQNATTDQQTITRSSEMSYESATLAAPLVNTSPLLQG